jgi:hypothetical protein
MGERGTEQTNQWMHSGQSARPLTEALQGSTGEATVLSRQGGHLNQYFRPVVLEGLVRFLSLVQNLLSEPFSRPMTPFQPARFCDPTMRAYLLLGCHGHQRLQDDDGPALGLLVSALGCKMEATCMRNRQSSDSEQTSSDSFRTHGAK